MWDNFQDTLIGLSSFQWVILSLLLNGMLFLLSIVIHIYFEKTSCNKPLQNSLPPLSKSDILSSIITILCNSLVMFIGVTLWKKEWILIHPTGNIIHVILEVFLFIIIMDFLMYVFHYVAHSPYLYRLMHRKHHEHISTNFLSLFVIHPLESLGFGLMMIVLLMCYNFSLLGVTLYIMINLIWGTAGHLNREFFPARSELMGIGTTQFHNKHHLSENKNFGFYTNIWDRIFNTYEK